MWRGRLRGRWRWVVLGAVLGTLAGGAAGWWLGGEAWRAVGAVRLAAVDDINLTVAGEAEAQAGGGGGMVATVAREAALLERLGGGRVTVAREAAAGGGPEAAAAGTTGPTVASVSPGAARLVVSSVSPRAVEAEDAVAVTLAAYAAQTPLNVEAEGAARWAQAAQRYRECRADLLAARAALGEARDAAAGVDVSAAGGGPAGASIEERWSSATATLERARRDEAAARERLAQAESAPAPTAAALAAVDQGVRDRLERLRGIERALSDIGPWLDGRWEALKAQRSALQEGVAERAAGLRLVRAGEVAGAGAAGEGDGPAAVVSLTAARGAVERANEAVAVAEGAVEAARPGVERWRGARAEVERLEMELARRELELAGLERPGGVRLAGVDVPGAAAVRRVGDTRPERAGWGAAAGMLLGAGLATLILVSDGRVRPDAAGGLVGVEGGDMAEAGRLLAVVPYQGDGGGGGGSGAAVQGLRVVLEGRMARGERSVVVMGVGPGSGATSVTVGSAAALAIGGSRVLLVDLTWLHEAGAGLTGDEEALRRGLGVDGTLAALGYLEDEDREELMLGEGERVGFGPLLRGGGFRESVVATRLGAGGGRAERGGLDVLSAMGAGATLREEFRGRVSSKWVARLLAEAGRSGYEAVVVDGGAVGRGVEGLLAASVADGVVVVVSREESQRAYAAATARLGLVGARVWGSVLNRAGGRGSRRGEGGAGGRRYAGGSVGSGIFAAAVEAHSGVPRGSGLISLYADDEADSHGAGDVALTHLNEKDDAAAASNGHDVHTVQAVGLDPVDEPEAVARPTPQRTPPRTPPRPARREAGAAGKPATPPAPECDPAFPTLVEEVMDQMVSRAIRSARRPDPGDDAEPPRVSRRERRSAD